LLPTSASLVIDSPKSLPYELALFLNEKASLYNQKRFIEPDPISVPHAFSSRADIEIAGLFAALFAWGQRKTVLAKSWDLLGRMGNEPARFITEASHADLDALSTFQHRTFSGADARFIVLRLRDLYLQHTTLENAFVSFSENAPSGSVVEQALIGFHSYIFEAGEHLRTRRHISTPLRGSACKRLCMYLRWMIRHDNRGVDFGLWRSFSPAELICPLDVHVARIARALGLLSRTPLDWRAANELTAHLRILRPDDPAIYDFALFGLGVERWPESKPNTF
jgi:uncharacterized protein (TIGR02757 family)